MKSSTLFECGPSLPKSTLCPPDGASPVYYTECKLKNKKWRRPGNEAGQQLHSTVSILEKQTHCEGPLLAYIMCD